MQSIAYSAGTLIFATAAAVACSVLQTSHAPVATSVAIGVLIGFAALLYFIRLVRSGNVLRFGTEAWLAGAVCYLLLKLIVVGVELDRQDTLSSMAAWAAAMSSLIVPRAATLAELGAGILIICFFARIYLARRI
jgi:hypothetical protein